MTCGKFILDNKLQAAKNFISTPTSDKAVDVVSASTISRVANRPLFQRSIL